MADKQYGQNGIGQSVEFGRDGVSVASPSMGVTAYTLTLPAVASVSIGQVLSSTDTSGTLEWTTPTVGDVVGPASATDNAIVRFDLTTGKLVQNSVVTIADSTGDMSGVGSLSATSATLSGLTASRALVSDGSKVITASATTDTEIGYVSGVTSAIQTQLNGKAASGANTDITSVLLNQTGLVVKGGDANALTIKPNETLTGAKTLNIIVNDTDRTIDLSGNLTVSSAATISGTNTGDQNLFSTFAVSGQSNVVADSTSDTLTLVAGTNISITTDDTTDSITINNTAPSSSIQPISASVGSNQLTISASALTLDFRSTTLGSGTVTKVTGTPSNLVISSGSTLGTIDATQSQIVVLAINNAGTIELAAVNFAGGVDLSETGVISTTAEGGAGGADSASTIYSTTARSNVAYRVIGIIQSTQATAGTWATSPSLIQGMGGSALQAMQSLGYGQPPQDVTGSRSSGVTYYNTTGRTILVILSTGNASAGSISIQTNGLTIITSNYGAGEFNSATFLVLPGQSYVMTTTHAIQSVIEYR